VEGGRSLVVAVHGENRALTVNCTKCPIELFVFLHRFPLPMVYDEMVDVARLVKGLLRGGRELEWVEFKQNNGDPAEIGQYISAIANSAALHGESAGFVVWGVEDGTHTVTGTTFSPKTAKKGNQLLEIWLAHLLNPRVDFRFHEGSVEGKRVVVLEIPCATVAPVCFEGEEYIRIGSSRPGCAATSRRRRSSGSVSSVYLSRWGSREQT
jgi:uncharacterized protein (DUF1330 family)